jgi:hypothetical protein
MFDSLRVAFDQRKLPSPEPGSMAYMMSKDAICNGNGDHLGPHLMFIGPPTDGAVWGAGFAGAPVTVYQAIEERLRIVVVPLGKWSDGTVASHEEN